MLSRFVTTSRTRIINPRYVVPCTLQLLVLMAPSLFSSLLFLLPISSRESERVLVQQATGPLLRAEWLEGRNTYDFFHLLSPLNTHPSFATAPLPWSRPGRGTPNKFFFNRVLLYLHRYTRAYKRLEPRGGAGGRDFYDFFLLSLCPCVVQFVYQLIFLRATAVNCLLLILFFWGEYVCRVCLQAEETAQSCVSQRK